MSVDPLAVKAGIWFAFIGLLTILIRRLLPKKGTFTCFAIAFGAVSVLSVVAAILGHR